MDASRKKRRMQMSDFESKKENEFIEFIEKATNVISAEENTLNKKLSSVLESTTVFDKNKSIEIVDGISNTIQQFPLHLN
jgi:hypothetical protein